MLGVKILAAVIKQRTKAEMGAQATSRPEVRESSAKKGADNNFRDIFAVSMLNKILLEVKEGRL
jgi:hypothetical protein